MDHDNPHHQLKDKELGDKLGTNECQQQLLTWLVKGAVAWQRDGLPLLPDKMKMAVQAYVADNDHLQDFLDQSCELGAGFEVMPTCFHDSFKVKEPVSDKQIVNLTISSSCSPGTQASQGEQWHGKVSTLGKSVRMSTKMLSL